MKINRDNYEAYFLDYFEGQLSLEMVEEVLMFADQNPDLRNVLEDFEAVSLVADPCGRADEPEQLCDGTAAVPQCGGAQADAAGVASL